MTKFLLKNEEISKENGIRLRKIAQEALDSGGNIHIDAEGITPPDGTEEDGARFDNFINYFLGELMMTNPPRELNSRVTAVDYRGDVQNNVVYFLLGGLFDRYVDAWSGELKDNCPECFFIPRPQEK